MRSAFADRNGDQARLRTQALKFSFSNSYKPRGDFDTMPFSSSRALHIQSTAGGSGESVRHELDEFVGKQGMVPSIDPAPTDAFPLMDLMEGESRAFNPPPRLAGAAVSRACSSAALLHAVIPNYLRSDSYTGDG